MINCPLNPVLFGVVIALASILVVAVVSQPALASLIKGQAGGNGGNAGLFGNGGAGGAGGLADIDIAEAEEAGNTTMADTTNQTTTNTTEVQFLSIQNAKSGSLSQINATDYTLELNNVANNTILFSDRPERIVKTVSTNDFVGNWTAGQNSLRADEPNDALIVENNQTGKLETAIVESFNPVYDTKTNTLTYTIMAENATSINLPSESGQSTLVIDDIDEFINKLKSGV